MPVRLGTAGAGLPEGEGRGLGDDRGTHMPSCGINRSATLGEPQTFKTGYSAGVGDRFLVFHVKLFLKTGFFGLD